MHLLYSLFEWICLIPVIGGSIYFLLSLLAIARFRALSSARHQASYAQWPPATLLKPVCGLDKNQRANLRSACLQDYPQYQVVFAVQGADDPVIPLLREIEGEFGTARVTVAIEDRNVGPNGKINNLIGALSHARHDVLVISDSDVRLEPDYLKAIVTPLADPDVGYVCTLYKAVHGNRWFEKMALLTFNAAFTPSVIFAYVSGASRFCLGSTVALRRESLNEIGGFEAVADCLAEDYEMGRRLCLSGRKMVLVRHFVDLAMDLKDFSEWWNYQVCWDQKTRAAEPAGFFATLVTHSIPFALLFAAYRTGDRLGLAVLGTALAIRLLTAAVIMGWGLRDREGVKSLFLLPLRDIAALASWALAFTKNTVIWRRKEFTLTRGGRLVIREARP